MFHKLLLGLISLSLLSCATVFSDSSDIINFTSVPEGADVYINGRKIGQTPISEKFVRDTFSKSTVQVKLNGYEEQRFVLQKQLNKVSLINFTFWPSWATDALSGNMVQYSPNSYHIFLKQEKQSQLDYDKKNQAQQFVLKQYHSLLKEVSQGSGENLHALWKLHAQEKMSYPDYLAKLEGHSKVLLETTRPAEFYLKVDQLI